MADIFDKIDINDLTPDLKLIYDCCGMEAVRNLLRHLGGINFYIPKITRLEAFIKRYINDNSDKSFKIMAFELGVSDQFLRIFSKRNM